VHDHEVDVATTTSPGRTSLLPLALARIFSMTFIAVRDRWGRAVRVAVLREDGAGRQRGFDAVLIRILAGEDFCVRGNRGRATLTQWPRYSIATEVEPLWLRITSLPRRRGGISIRGVERRPGHRRRVRLRGFRAPSSPRCDTWRVRLRRVRDGWFSRGR